MAPFFDPSAGMFGSPAGSGVLANPLALGGPISNPVQSPYDPQLAAAAEKANAEERLKSSALKQALFRAAALREQPLFAQGGGPLGIRIGQGPGGWAVSIGDLVGGLMAKKKLDEATAGVTGAQEALTPTENATNAAVNAARRQFVPVAQGSQLSSWDY